MPPRVAIVGVEARVEPLTGPLPAIGWRWDPETDILSGSFKGNRKSGGLTGTVELTDDEGSVAVLDVNNGVICGLDVVVWPEVTTVPDLKVPGQLTDGRVVVPSRPSRPGVTSVEVGGSGAGAATRGAVTSGATVRVAQAVDTATASPSRPTATTVSAARRPIVIARGRDGGGSMITFI